MPTYDWYAKLKKPSFAPPAWLFGPAWTILYVIIAISFAAVFWRAATGAIGFIIALPFILNLVFNFAFSPIQFRLQNNFWAGIDILLIWATIIWSMIVIWPFYNWISYAQIPYLIWVSFATVLQLTITYLNRKKK